MAYRLRLDEAIGENVRRIANEQFAAAERVLVEGPDLEVAVHSARKAIKRLRALLSLLGPGIEPADFKRENRRLRDIGRLLAGRRDTDVLHATLIQLTRSGEMGRFNSDAGIQQLIAVLDQRRAELINEGDPRPAAKALARARRKFRKLEIKADGADTIAEGFAHTYAGCQSAYGVAMVSPTVDHIHELRKNIQRHWRHMQVLAPLWPGMFKARVQIAREISGFLGTDHDLALAMEFLEQNGKPASGGKFQRKLLEIASGHQFEARQRAFSRAEILLANEVREWRRVLPKYWRSAHRMTEESVEAAV
ncbi:MAG: hypothetical protein RLZ98_3076 [Pseudomonadota bacterium]